MSDRAFGSDPSSLNGGDWPRSQGTDEPISRDNLREVEASLTRRVQALENKNQRLSGAFKAVAIALGAVMLGLVGLVITTVVSSEDSVLDTVQARQFVLRDETGLARGIWEINPESGPQLILRDGDGRERIQLALLRDGSPGITLGDRDGRPRIVLGFLPDGTTNLVLADAAGQTRALLGHSSADATTLLLADREGLTRAGLVVDPEGEGTLTLFESPSPVEAAPAPVEAAPAVRDTLP